VQSIKTPVLILIDTSSILSDGMEALYSKRDEPAFSGETIFLEFIMKLFFYILESIYQQTSPSPSNTVPFNANSTSNKSILQKF
jgi:hypothetical protein